MEVRFDEIKSFERPTERVVAAHNIEAGEDGIEASSPAFIGKILEKKKE